MRSKILEEEIYLPEATGSQPKYWLCSHDIRYLLKLCTYKENGNPVYNDVSECMACDVARLLNLDVAAYYLCEKDGKKGVITIDFLDNLVYETKKEEFFDGVFLISRIDPNFKNKSLMNRETHQFYTIDLILRSIEDFGLIKDALNMLVFDALIGNRDRNPSNYGIILNHETGLVRFAPLFDNATSLGVSMVEHRLREVINENGEIIDEDRLNTVVHDHIVLKTTLDRFFLYKEKRLWDEEECNRIIKEIELKKKLLLKELEENHITREMYHKTLRKIENSYRKYDITKLKYQVLIEHLTNYYSDEIEDIIESIKNNITKENIDNLFDFYLDELPIDRVRIAKEIVLRRANWIVDYYYKNRLVHEGGKVLCKKEYT